MDLLGFTMVKFGSIENNVLIASFCHSGAVLIGHIRKIIGFYVGIWKDYPRDCLSLNLEMKSLYFELSETERTFHPPAFLSTLTLALVNEWT